ncbi:MAG: PEPxxWA-CTERM sorting domain-containing protein [Sphingomonadaceae bacterium]
MRIVAPALVSALLAAAPLSASPLTFFDGFEGETAGGSILNYSGFANWTVSDGTVDLIRSGEFGISCRTGNYCVDLDGSTGDAGILALTTPVSIAAGDVVDIVSWISGNQRGGASDEVWITMWFSNPIPLTGFQFLTEIGYSAPFDTLSTPGASIQRFIAPGDGFNNYGFRFTAGAATTMTLRFDNRGGDNIGVILDDVSISINPRAGVVPEPATWAMLIAGFGLVGAAMRRRRPASA